MRKNINLNLLSDSRNGFYPGELKTLGTQMGYPIGVLIWVLHKNKSFKIINTTVKVINN